MTARGRRLAFLAGSALLVNLLYFWVARILLWSYPMKATVRLGFFLGLPIIDWLCRQHLSWRDLWRQLRPDRQQMKRLLLTLVIGVAAIVAFRFVAGPLCRLLGIEAGFAGLVEQTGTGRNSLWFFLIYLPLVNALAEELFFRFYLYREIAALGLPRTAMLYPAALFSFYHLSIIQVWFSPWLIGLMLAGLFAAGLYLNHMIRRDRHIFSVWLVHGLANILIVVLSLQYV